MAPGSPFGPGIGAPIAYLHHGYHVGYEHLSRIAHELFGLTVSEGAIANMYRRLRTSMDAATTAIWACHVTSTIAGRSLPMPDWRQPLGKAVKSTASRLSPRLEIHG